MTRMYTLSSWTLVASGCLLVTVITQAAEKRDPVPSGFSEIIPQQEAAIEKGVAWLAKNQNKDGSWANSSGENYTCAMTGFAGLALLASGNTPGRGPYGRNLVKAIQYFLKHQDGTGHITSQNEGRSMYGHGLAMTFLSQCYGMKPGGEYGPKIKRCLEKAIKLTARSQSYQGGWNYSPNSSGDEGSVTIKQIQGLRGCQNVGISVPFKVLERALDYVKKSQQPDGGVAYRAGMTGSRPALTAAGAELFLMAGRYEAKETSKAIDYVKRHITSDSTRNQHDSYTTFYAAQALHQVGGKHWAKYFEGRRKRYLREQNRDGSWRYSGWGASPVFDTSVAVITLALPYEYLPLYQR